VLLEPDRAAALEADGGTTPAAVLVPLYRSGDDVGIVFTRRREDLRNHAGQISFPGGRRDPEDASLVATALREAHEEIGLDPAGVQVLGALQPTPTIATNFTVYPFVGLIESGQAWTPSAREVDAVLELSLRELSAGYTRRRLTRRGMSLRTDAFVVGEHLIWGATARILMDLLERLERVELAAGDPAIRSPSRSGR
jgi:8-oxo-dGTP pyrophosphatase MutT (NUDIX family)